jgi:hypothetical protein
VQDRVLVEQLVDEVRLDRPAVGEAAEIERHVAAEEVGPCPVQDGVTRMKERRLPITEGAQRDLGRPPAEKRALSSEDLPLHEADIGAAEDQEDPARVPPLAVPPLLEDRRKLRARLSTVHWNSSRARISLPSPRQRETTASSASPPALGRERGEERLVQHGRRLLQEFTDLQGGRSLLADEVHSRTAFHEMEDQLALAHRRRP